ncbi:hypothetical protein CAEBREN_08431 [Caenorhabditis brenneri]|uniref:Fibronectin type-III domain-containing protein n=1 Tax=Caenorhabditis brenneri TaxID=135651 RepID=G0MHK0_CAEBE|nr:hypothetical protein CAEBREN_08431 [Caenorhabditis brenneri]
MNNSGGWDPYGPKKHNGLPDFTTQPPNHQVTPYPIPQPFQQRVFLQRPTPTYVYQNAFLNDFYTGSSIRLGAPNIDMEGPGTVRALASHETVSRTLNLSVPESFYVHQFRDEEYILRHLVVSKEKIEALSLNYKILDKRVTMQKDIPTVNFQSNGGPAPQNNGRGNREQQQNDRGSNQGNSQNRNSNRRTWNRNGHGGNYARGNDNRPPHLLLKSEFPPLVPTDSVDEDPQVPVEFNGFMPVEDLLPDVAQDIEPPMAQYIDPAIVPNMSANVPPSMPASMPASMPVNMPQAMMPNTMSTMMPTMMPNMMTAPPPTMTQSMEMAPVMMQGTSDSQIGSPQGMPINDYPPPVYQPNVAYPQINGGPPPGTYGYVDHRYNNNNNTWKYVIPGEEDTLARVLSTIKTPILLRPFPTGGEFAFELIKLNDFQYFNGIRQFNHVPIDDLAYYVLVTNMNGASALNSKLDNPKIEDNFKATFILNTLRPNTNYKVCLYAALVQRGIFGKRTETLTFKTSPGRPDAPTRPEVGSRGLHYFSLKWKPAVNNGAFVCMYHVYVFQDQFGNGRMLTTTDEKIEIKGLEPATRYKVMIYALNALGESLEAAEFDVWTKTTERPLPAQNLTVVPTSNHCLELTWQPDANSNFSVELYPPPLGLDRYVREGIRNANTVINGLLPNTLYQVRVIARSDYGEAFTNWVDARTQTTRQTDNPNEKDTIEARTPAKPKFHSYKDNFPKMSWTRIGDPGDYTYIVQGSTYEAPDDFIELHHGGGGTYIVEDDTIHYLRYIQFFKRSVKSLPSPKVVVPRDYSKNRPERIKEVKLSIRRRGEVLVEFTKLDRERMNIPESAKIVYFVQRCDFTDNEVLSIREANRCTFTNIPGLSKVEVQVRASVIFHGVLTHGDWSIPVQCTTPRDPPPPANNLKFQVPIPTLTWDCPDPSHDLFFMLDVIQLTCNRSILKLRSTTKNLVMDNLQLGERYKASVQPGNNVGLCQEITSMEFEVPPQKPTVTSIVTVKSHTNKLVFEWDKSIPNGREITIYQLVLSSEDEKFDDKVIQFKVDGNKKFTATFGNLKPDSEYSMKFSAANSVGYSEKPKMLCRTLPDPPSIPKISGECEATSVKIRWDPSPNMNYKLVRINKRGQHISIYEGIMNQTRAKGLKENTRYVFKLRVRQDQTKAEAWSEEFEFTTTVAPPPTVKATPTIDLVAGTTHSYRVEWQQYLSQNSLNEQFYRLQVVDATIKGSKWENVYEGTRLNFVLNTKRFPGALHVRVLCVRKQEDGEMCGSPSPVGYIANVPPEIEAEEVEPVVAQTIWYMSPWSILLITLCCLLLFASFFPSVNAYFRGLMDSSSR